MKVRFVTRGSRLLRRALVTLAALAVPAMLAAACGGNSSGGGGVYGGGGSPASRWAGRGGTGDGCRPQAGDDRGGREGADALSVRKGPPRPVGLQRHLRGRLAGRQQ